MRALEFITGHVIYNPAYTYKLQLKITIHISHHDERSKFLIFKVTVGQSCT